MPYPSRPVLEPLEEFKGSATVRQSPEQRARLIAQQSVGSATTVIVDLTCRVETSRTSAIRSP